ncbi:MAG: SUMF1/EgtB/PvdO family nonheme iron enzyme [Anaerolineales bacterium]|nr:SUMF1/EgtB/PvdO family nonheme iron enzyme [Anaerolineales bacterium]
MPNRFTLSRREFLKLAGASATSVILGACSTTLTQEQSIELPTETPIEPSLPTESPPIEPIFPDMVRVEAGSFDMGSEDGFPDEQPVHTVNISRAFHISRYEVTFDEYERFIAYAGGKGITRPDDLGFGRGDRPVFWIKWFDAVAYCNWLSENAGLMPCYSGPRKLVKWDVTADGYRLPTEAEWEYAARGGPLSRGYLYAGSNDPDKVAWYGVNSGDQTYPVGKKASNELGLYDMSGNIWEWCWDWYREDTYASSPTDDPIGPESAREMHGVSPIDAEKVRRGGDWGENVECLRVCARSADLASYPVAGIRLVRLAE